MEIIIIFAAACLLQVIASDMKPAEPEPWKHKKRPLKTTENIETIRNI